MVRNAALVDLRVGSEETAAQQFAAHYEMPSVISDTGGYNMKSIRTEDFQVKKNRCIFLERVPGCSSCACSSTEQ